MATRVIKGKPPRLKRIFPSIGNPLCFVTICTLHRQKSLANRAIHEAFVNYARQALEGNRAWVGDYVIMPDHLHFFVKLGTYSALGSWIRGLKRFVASPDFKWQPGFFDRVLRSRENYSKKWNYVEQNPVRAGLVSNTKDWPFKGQIYPIQF